MAGTTSGSSFSVTRLVLVPSLLSLAITILRVIGELRHWPKPWFSTSAGGGGAIVGIVWLVFIFGPYFALKLARVGQGPTSVGKAIGLSLLSLIVALGGSTVAFAPQIKIPGRAPIGYLIVIAAGGLVLIGWPSLFKALLAYAYAARIPVAIVMFFAMQGNWGTHYDVLPPGYSGPTSFWPKYALIGLLPQLIFWVVFTITVGALFGSIAAAIAGGRRASAPTQAAA